MLDPTLVPGIYNTCDQWCMYCPATRRCLAYRCQPENENDRSPGDIYENIAQRMLEGMQMLRELTAAEGRTLPELEALLSDEGPLRAVECVPVDDPLERLGRRYAVVSSRYIESHPAFPFTMTYRPGGPTPFEVFAWYRVLIAVKIFRALSSSAAAARGGVGELGTDALYSARTALVGIDRSRAALETLRAGDDDARLGDMEAQLRRLAREVEARFPGARGMVRPGLDDHAGECGEGT